MRQMRRWISLEVQTLEGRALLSTLGHAPKSRGTVELAAQAALTKLTANLSGKYALGGGAITLTIQSSSTVQKLAGTVKGSGVLKLEGGVITGGRIQFGNKKGSITLDVVGEVPLPASAKAKLTLNLVVFSGTGALSSLSGPVLAKLSISAKNPTAGTFGGTAKTS